MPQSESERLREIVLIEDERSDAQLLIRAFLKAKVANPVHHIQDGDAALRYFTELLGASDSLLPALILLDVNIPQLSGLSILGWLRGQKRFHPVPVVMLTGSSDPQTVRAAMTAGANSYLFKTANEQEVLTMVRTIANYWIVLNQSRIS